MSAAPFPRRLALVLAAGLVAALAGCGTKRATKDAPPAPKAPPFEETILARIKNDGLTAGSFAATGADAYGAVRCVRGPVEKLDVLLCQYPDEAAAKAAEQRLLGFVASAVSGATRRSGAVAMAVADRDKADLPGKQIARLARVFTSGAASR